jgi:hypothetical protein
MNQFTQTDFQLPVAQATSKCGIESKVFTITDQSIHFQSVKFVASFCIHFWNSSDAMISCKRTIFGSGFGIWIQTVSVPGIGATILNDFDFKDNLISFANDSIFEIATQASGLILT